MPGTDEQYVCAAIRQGFDELGFSDHVPWPYQNGFSHPGVRMSVLQLSQYLNSVRELARRYRDQIQIYAGFECEHFPEYMSWLEDMAAENELDYLIFGNHYEDSDEYGFYFGSARTPDMLRRYVKSAEKGIQTGLFAYLAHPDLFMRSYKPFDENCPRGGRDLCQAWAMDMPMEYNVHDRFISGITHRKSYPDPEFFRDCASGGGSRADWAGRPMSRRSCPTRHSGIARCGELEPFGGLLMDHLTLNK